MTVDRILEYLERNGGIFRNSITVLKSRRISNFYVNARILNNVWHNADGGELLTRDSEEPIALHGEFLYAVGRRIGEHANRLGVNMLVGVVTIGATLAHFAGLVSGIPVCFWDPHDDNPVPDDDVIGKRVLIVDDTTTTGGSIADAVAVCSSIGAEVVGALTLIRRDPEKIGAKEVGLVFDEQEFISLLDIDFPIVIEEANEDSTLLKSGLPVRLDVGYAATDDWPTLRPDLTYVGKPKPKFRR